MTIALTGAHRTGKTTLARLFCEKHNFTLITSNASQIFQRLGLDVNGDLSFDERMRAQEAILEAHKQAVLEAPGTSMCDRSVLDMAAYSILDYGKRAVGDQHDRLMQYVDKCVELSEWLYPAVILVQPGIKYVEEVGKPKHSAIYQYSINLLCDSLIRKVRNTTRSWALHEENTELVNRLTSLEGIVSYINSEVASVVRH